MAIKHVFLNSLNFCKYIFASGKEANFISGQYLTSDPAEIEELTREAGMGHPHISIPTDEAKRTIDTTITDPLIAIKAKAVAEYLAAQAAAALDPVTQLKTSSGTDEADKPKEMGNTASLDELKSRLNMSNSSTVAAAMAGSVGAA